MVIKMVHVILIQQNFIILDSVIMNTRLIDFFLVPAESLLLSMSDNMVRTDSVSTDFRLL